MWTRKELKDKAKLNLNKNYWMVVLVTFIVMITSGGSGSFGGSFGSGFSNGLKSGSQQQETQQSISQWDNEEFNASDEDISGTMETIKDQYSHTFTKSDGFVLAGIGAFILIIVLIIFVYANLE